MELETFEENVITGAFAGTIVASQYLFPPSKQQIHCFFHTGLRQSIWFAKDSGAISEFCHFWGSTRNFESWVLRSNTWPPTRYFWIRRLQCGGVFISAGAIDKWSALHHPFYIVRAWFAAGSFPGQSAADPLIPRRRVLIRSRITPVSVRFERFHRTLSSTTRPPVPSTTRIYSELHRVTEHQAYKTRQLRVFYLRQRPWTITHPSPILSICSSNLVLPDGLQW